MIRPHLRPTALRRAALAVVLSLLSASPALAQRREGGTVTGRVTDRASGEALVAVQVVVEGTRLGQVTGDDGRYTIVGVPSGTRRITARRIGYVQETRTVTVADAGTVTADFALAHGAVALSEVVVTATGEQRTRELGNAVSTIDSSVFANAPIRNTQDLLTARATGVTVLQNSGQPGSGGTIRLRGVNSISQGNDPLIYVDGVRIYNGRTSTSVSGRQSVAPLNDIDPADIDRVEIVKGPAATTLYGTEASGGVIQIFTKHGTSGKPQWSAEVTEGVNNMGHVGPASDPTGLFFNECRGPDLVNGLGVKFEDPTCPASGSWLRNAAVQRYSLGVRGGSPDGFRYFVSSNYASEGAVLPTGGNTDGGVRANLGFSPARGLNVSVNSSLLKRTVTWYPDGNSANGALLNISRGPGSNFKGAGCSDPTLVCVLNDSLFALNSFTTTNHFVTGGVVTYTPIEQLTNRLAVGYDYNDADISSIVPFGYLRVPTGTYYQTLWNRTLITVDAASSLKHPFGANFLSTTSVGGQLFDSRLRSTDLEADNFSGPGEPTLISGSLRTINDVSQQRVINAGFFAQQEVGWRDRLFVIAGLRVDGNSAFGKSFGLQAYPKVSASYVISDEDFFPKHYVETLKLRGALGESGKAPGAFDAVRTYDPVAAENGQSAFTPSQIGNPNLGPERTRETELGFDLTALESRLSVGYTYYHQHTIDALIPVSQPPSLGFSNPQLTNVGELFSSGNELSVALDVLRRDNVGLTARTQFSTFNSKAGNLGGQTITIAALSRSYVREGFPVPAYIGKRVTNPNDYADPIYEDDAFLGATFPTRIISPSLSLTLFRSVTIDALGEFQRGGHLLNAMAYQNAFLNSWQPCYAAQNAMRQAAAGDASALAGFTALQRARCTLSGTERDYSLWVESSDFFKLRQLSLTYDVPARFLRGAHSASLTFAGRNLYTSTKYSGTDPEVADQRDNSFSRRDYYVFPTYRSFTASLRLGF